MQTPPSLQRQVQLQQYLHTPNPTPARFPVAASRVGKRSISGHVDPAVQKQLRHLATDLERSHQSLLDEALNDLFRKYGKSAIA